MKECIRNTKSRDELIFLFFVYKMVDISAETFAKNCIHTIKQLK